MSEFHGSSVLPFGKLRYITTGQVGMPGRIEVLSGLAMGEQVVLHGPAPDWAAPAPGQLPLPAGDSSGETSERQGSQPGLVPVQPAPATPSARGTTP